MTSRTRIITVTGGCVLVGAFFFARPVFAWILMPKEYVSSVQSWGGTGTDSSAPYFVPTYGHYRNALTLELKDGFVQEDGHPIRDTEVYEKVVGMLAQKKYDVLVLLVARTENMGSVVRAAGILRRTKEPPVVIMYDSR